MSGKHYSIKNYKLDESVGFLIKLASTSFERALAAEIRKKCPEATVAQWKILMLIGNKRCHTAAGLAEALECDMGSVTRTLDRLEAKGLVKRERSRTDKRLVHLSLTPEGMEVMPHLPEAAIEAMNEVLADFTMEEVEQLKDFLRRIIRNGQFAIAEVMAL
ncbi:Multiple antibiotic resistance protein MarR [Anaerolineae bacterium]|nr:Multiple antibiotic resistance protein MarR [Anaerolineae bacterium]